MKILLIGSGGREHSIAKKLKENKRVEKIFCAPGNGGTALEDKCENIDFSVNDIEGLLTFAKTNNIELTIVGPEEPLINGISDRFIKEGLKIFGPKKQGAMLEGSKCFSKDFMKKYGVKTAKYENFTDYDEALGYLREQEFPIVIKADGLALGKGVYICENLEQGEEALKDIMVNDIFKGAGKSIVIEEFLQGVEASILSITDGKTIKPFISAKDHKQVFDGGKGPNTGGMGVIAPNTYVTDEVLKEFEETIMNQTLLGIREEGFDFKGVIFFGIMITKKGTYLLEYNVRLGDPETQSVLALMESDFLELLESALNGSLDNFNISWKQGYLCNVVLTSKGYPGKYEKGYEITIGDKIKDNVIIAGATLKDGVLVTSGGRVLSLLGYGVDKYEAIKNAYDLLDRVNFYGKYCRFDIGK
ncbi:MAG: phosphoribosylamine--glycine ligase [Clostridium perfringens]|nr:phosphoribosylamine--glycine ligase [Clostridium perfringens]